MSDQEGYLPRGPRPASDIILQWFLCMIPLLGFPLVLYGVMETVMDVNRGFSWVPGIIGTEGKMHRETQTLQVRIG